MFRKKNLKWVYFANHLPGKNILAVPILYQYFLAATMVGKILPRHLAIKIASLDSSNPKWSQMLNELMHIFKEISI